MVRRPHGRLFLPPSHPSGRVAGRRGASPLLGGRAPRAALPAAVLMACPPPYFLLLSALPPPMYPSVLALCGLLMVLALRIADHIESGRAVSAELVLAGTLAGLAAWTHLMSLSIVAA